MRTTIVDCLDELASLHTHPPLACGLRSVSMTRSTMSLQGQAEQPMMLRGLSVSSMVPDDPVPWPWTRAAGRVWFAAGWSGSKRSCTSAQPCSVLPGGHSGMAVWPFQGSGGLLLAALGVWRAGFAPLRPGAGRGRDQGPVARPRIFGYLARFRGGASAPPLHPSHAQNGKSRAPNVKCDQQKASTALQRPHRHAAVSTRQHAA